MAVSEKVQEARRASARARGDLIALDALESRRESAFRAGYRRARSARKESLDAMKLAEHVKIGPEPEGGAGIGDPGSGAKPSWRDPQSFAAVLASLVERQGWNRSLRGGEITAQWENIVGKDVARHCHIESFEDGILTIHTSSSAWAAQMRAFQGVLHSKINEEIGEGLVSDITVLGPRVPSTKRGRWAVPGRGNRDTYG